MGKVSLYTPLELRIKSCRIADSGLYLVNFCPNSQQRTYLQTILLKPCSQKIVTFGRTRRNLFIFLYFFLYLSHFSFFFFILHLSYLLNCFTSTVSLSIHLKRYRKYSQTKQSLLQKYIPQFFYHDNFVLHLNHCSINK